MSVYVTKTAHTVAGGIHHMIQAAIHDYSSEPYRFNEEMTKEFADGFVVKKGKKYIKILSGTMLGDLLSILMMIRSSRRVTF